MKLVNIFVKREYLRFLSLIIFYLGIVKLYFYFSPAEFVTITFTINLTIIIVHFFICIFIESQFDNNIIRIKQIEFERIISYMSLIVLAPIAINFLIGILLYNKYIGYKLYCPFTLSKIDYKLHLKRRCELYNINKENFYPYNYICTYNAEDNQFIMEKLALKLKLYPCSDFKCSKVESLINNNEVIKKFFNEYYKENLYYCDTKQAIINSFSYPIKQDLCQEYTHDYLIFLVIYIYITVSLIKLESTYFKNIKANINMQLYFLDREFCINSSNNK